MIYIYLIAGGFRICEAVEACLFSGLKGLTGIQCKFYLALLVVLSSISTSIQQWLLLVLCNCLMIWDFARTRAATNYLRYFFSLSFVLGIFLFSRFFFSLFTF